MQEYKFIHLLREDEFARLADIMAQPDVYRWLSNGNMWTREKMEQLRAWSQRDSDESRTRAYYYWAIIIDSRVAGIVGIHPVPWDVRHTQAHSRVHHQIMVAIAPEYRGRGIATRAVDDIIARTGMRVCAIVRADNEASLRAMRRAVNLRELSRRARIKGAPVVIFEAREV